MASLAEIRAKLQASNQQNSGNSSIVNSYRNSAGSLCLKLNRGSSGYSEGYVAVYFHTWDAPTQNAMGVAAFAQNNTVGNYY